MEREELLNLWKEKSVTELFPVKVGETTYTELQGKCSGCHKDIKAEYFRGSITSLFPNVSQFKAVGYCQECNVLSQYEYRLYSDARFTGKDSKGNWKEFQMKNLSKPNYNVYIIALLIGLIAFNLLY